MVLFCRGAKYFMKIDKYTLVAVIFAGMVAHSVGAPTNDDFANAEVVAGVSPSVSTSISGATREVIEPSWPSIYSTGSVWYKWISPGYGNLNLGALVSSPPSLFNHWLQVFVGSELSGLVEVARFNGSTEPRGDLLVGKDQTYYIRLSGGFPVAPNTTCNFYANLNTANFDQADFQSVSWKNDNFAEAIELVGARAKAIGYPSAATREAGEPLETGMNTLWWKWKAPSTGMTIVSTLGSGYNSVLTFGEGGAVHTFDYKSKGALTPGSEASLVLKTTAGHTYYFATGHGSNEITNQDVVSLFHTPVSFNSGGSGVGGRFTTLSRDVVNKALITGVFNSPGLTSIKISCSQRMIANYIFFNRATNQWSFRLNKFTGGIITGTNVTVVVEGIKNGRTVAKVTKTFKIW